MTDIKFSGLATAAPLTGSEIVPVVATPNLPATQTTTAAIAAVLAASATAAGTLTGTETVGGVQSGGNVKITAAQIASYIAGLSPLDNLTLAILRQQYPTNTTGVQTVNTLDCGMCAYSAQNSTWYPLHPFVLAQSAMPIVLPPNSTATAPSNGAFTLATALPRTLGSCYMYFPANALYSGSAQACYYVIMTSTTQGTAYNNIYTGGQPLIPATPTGIVGTGAAWTQITGAAILLAQANIPANVMGQNGQVEFRFDWEATNTSGNKTVATLFGGSNIGSDTETTLANGRGNLWHMVRNAGAPNVQTCYTSTSGVPGTSSFAPTVMAVDTTRGQTMLVEGNIATATDWIIITSFSFTVTPSALQDAQLTPSVFIPTPSIIPPGAAALGLTNTWLAFPQLADVSFTAADVSHKLYAGQYYNANPPFSPSGGYLSNATVNGQPVLSFNQLGDGTNPGVATQNQSSQAGLLRYASASVPFYFEVAMTLSNFSYDHWAQIYLNPQEHNAANGGSYPYVEIDIYESYIFGRDANNYMNGACNSLIDWVNGSSSPGTKVTTNNVGPAIFGPNINLLQENIFGVGWNPTTRLMQWWLNGAPNFSTTVSVATAGRMTGKHYYLTFGAGQNGAFVPYSQYIRYIRLDGG